MKDPYEYPGRRERESILLSHPENWPMVTRLPLKRVIDVFENQATNVEFAMLRKVDDQYVLDNDTTYGAYTYETIEDILNDRWHID